MTEPDNPDLVVGDDGLARPAWAAADPLLREYYDTEWGMPVRDERGVFERLSLEAFQSGLSWATILRKRPAFREGGVWWWMHRSWRGVLCLVLGLVRMCVVMRWRVWWLVSRPRRWVGFWGTGVGR